MRMHTRSILCCLGWSFTSLLAAENLEPASLKPLQFGQSYAQAERRQLEGADAYSLSHVKLSQEFVDELYRQIEVFDRVMQKNQIKYSISSGTLLGAIRNGGLIMGDDDIDVYVDLDDIYKYPPDTNWWFQLTKCSEWRYADKWKQALKDFQSEGFDADGRDWRVYKIGDPNKTKEMEARSGHQFPGLDVFPMKKQGKVYRYYDNFAYYWWDSTWRNMAIDASAWESEFDTVSFGHLQVKSIPFDYATQHLKKIYGDDVFYVTYKIMDHTTHKSWKKVKTKLLPEDYYYLAASQDPHFNELEFRASTQEKREYWQKGKWVEKDVALMRKEFYGQ